MNREVLKTLRGDVLQFIYNVAPSKVKESSITSAYYQYYNFKDIQRAIQYLVDKTYIEIHELASPTNARKKDRFYTVTADGMLVVERTKEDIGISIEEEA